MVHLHKDVAEKRVDEIFRIGELRLDVATNELTSAPDGQSQHLEPKTAEVLAYLARHAGKVVSREDLLAAAWPGVVVGDDALTQAIIKLRKAMGDDARQPRYIETISKRGYRLIAPVSGLAVPPADTPSSAPAAATKSSRPVGWLLGLGLGLTVVALFFALSPYGGPDRKTSQVRDEAVRTPTASPPIVAVLPLANLSGDPEREYFSDGITEDIIGALGRYSGLRVIARNSVEQFKQRPATAHVVRQELGADYILAGSVRRRDGGIRTAVELSDTGNAQVLWSESFEGHDFFEIQERIVQQIVGTLAVKLTRLEQRRVATMPTGDMAAYDLVLHARSLVVKTDRSANREARALLARALELAPDYAEIYVVLAQAEFHRAMYGWVEDAATGFARSEAYALKALATDDPQAKARAHGHLSLVFAVRREFDKALLEADKAIAANPSDAFAIDARGDVLLWSGRLEESIAAMETAGRLDPVGRSAGSKFDLVLAYYSLGRYDQALVTVDSALARFPDAAFLHALRAATLAQMGKLEQARQAAEKVRHLAPFFPARSFGNRFIDPAHMAQLQAGLRKAGLL